MVAQKLPSKQLVRDMIDRGWTVSEIAKRYNVRRQTVWVFLNKAERREIPMDKVIEMRAEGMSSSDIAKKLGFTAEAIRRKWNKKIKDKDENERKRHRETGSRDGQSQGVVGRGEEPSGDSHALCDGTG